MPALTVEQARKYYDSLPEKPEGDASNTEWLLAWFEGAVNAGVPDAIRIAGGHEGAPEKGDWEEEGGTTMPWQDAAEPEEWLGKRAPTPRELRKWAADQHKRYVSGDTSAQDEDYARFSDRVLADLIKKTWDVEGGGWKPEGGNPWRSYDESGNVVADVGGGPPGSAAAGAGGPAAAAKPAEPAKPVTHTEGDEALTYTGNPLVDNMIQMFNQAQAQRKTVEGGGEVDRAQIGHFGRGENLQVGGGDDLNKLAGMLMGTGSNAFLWTAVDDEAFGGLTGQHTGEAATTEEPKPSGPSVSAIANPAPPPVEETVESVTRTGPAPMGPGGPRIPTYKREQIGPRNVSGGRSPLSGMLANEFGTGFGNRAYR
jgi:hypothetical protein